MNKISLSYKGDYPKEMDKECIPICDALNSLPSVETTDSCCGHGKGLYGIFFTATDWRAISFLGRCIDWRYWKYGSHWRIEVSNFDLGGERAVFRMTSVDVKGEEAYIQILDLVKNMDDHINRKSYKKHFMSDLSGFVVSEAG